MRAPLKQGSCPFHPHLFLLIATSQPFLPAACSLTMKFSIIALAGLAAAAAPPADPHVVPHMHHHVNLERFSSTDCVRDTDVGDKHTLKRGVCYELHKHGRTVTAARSSIEHNRKNRIGTTENCRVYLYSDEKCKKNEVPTEDLWNHSSQCGKIKPIKARSAMLKCWKTRDGAQDGEAIVFDEDSDNIDVVTTIVQGPQAQTLTLQQPAAVQSSNGILWLSGAAPSQSLVTVAVPVAAAPTPQAQPGTVLTIEQHPQPKPVTTIGPANARTTIHVVQQHESVRVITLTVPVTKNEEIHWTTVTTTMGLSEFLAKQTAHPTVTIPPAKTN
ncbi:hypothetical protein CB0940_08922 [Cercospora beticola]|uniref:Uncharacterized protein n=1 Tax=Cercospora beticola TaxID=122368 RepID=A0A2G5HPM0_CERBT|nr:hypothetical protein CB0940_08922 [Cercospora beticola]PIA94458.1 hypothetical protein CB0940_08922 [Cercospora beticola]WPB05517.1 hypothetical protein RHO25_010170 [Cercospora beticola]